MTTEIQSPVVKAVTSLAASGGASAAQAGMPVDLSHFLPGDLAGWASLLASVLACVYTFTLWCEWWWKKFWKPLLRKYGWIR